VIPRFVFTTLLSIMAVLIVSFGVLMGGFGIATAAGDAAGARGLLWLAIACALLLVVDCLLLLAALGIEQLARGNCQPKADQNRTPTSDEDA
jgi:hypothetical protein